MKQDVKNFLALYFDEDASGTALSSFLETHTDALLPILEFLSRALPNMPAGLPSTPKAQKDLILSVMDSFDDSSLGEVARNFSGFAADLGGESETGKAALSKGSVRPVWTERYGNFKDIPEAPDHFISVRNVNRAIRRLTSAKNNLQITLFLADELINNPEHEITIGARDIPLEKLVGYYKRNGNYGIYCHPELTSYICDQLDIAPLLTAQQRPHFHGRKHFNETVLRRGYVDPADGAAQNQQVESLVNELLAGPAEIDIPLNGKTARIAVADYAGYFRVAGSSSAIPMLHEDLRELADQKFGILPQPTGEDRKKYITLSDLTKQLYRGTRNLAERSKEMLKFIQEAKDEVVDEATGLKASECVKQFRTNGRNDRPGHFIDRRIIPWLEYNYIGKCPENEKEFWKTGDPLMRELRLQSRPASRQIMQEILHEVRTARRDETIATAADGEKVHIGDAIRRFNSTAGLVYYVDVRQVGALAEKGVDLVSMLHQRALDAGVLKCTPNNRHLFERTSTHRGLG